MRKLSKSQSSRERGAVSHNELLYRFRLIEDAISLRYFFGVGLNERKRDKISFGLHLEERTRNIIAAFIFLQLAAILDSNGQYSLHVNRNTFQITGNQLSKLFPSVPDDQIRERTHGVNRVLKRHAKLIKMVFSARNEKIAHVSRQIHKFDSDGKHSWFMPVPLVPSSIRFRQIINFLQELDDELLFPNYLHGL
jgi:hypothetical protein